MGIRAKTPRENCPACDSINIYAGTILDCSDGAEIRVIGSVRCNDCELEIREVWDVFLGDDYDRERLGALVEKWNTFAKLAFHGCGGTAAATPNGDREGAAER